MLIGLQDELLIHVILNQFVRTGANGVEGEVLTVGCLGYDTYFADGQNKCGVRFAELDGNITAIGGDAFHSGKIQTAGVTFCCFKAEHNILGGDSSSVGEHGIITQRESVGQCIFADSVVSSQISNNLHVSIGPKQSGIENLDTIVESIQRIVVGGNLIESDNDFIFLALHGSLIRLVIATIALNSIVLRILNISTTATGSHGKNHCHDQQQRNYSRDGTFHLIYPFLSNGVYYVNATLLWASIPEKTKKQAHTPPLLCGNMTCCCSVGTYCIQLEFYAFFDFLCSYGLTISNIDMDLTKF